jgi:branched-chain amino acid aminotransferase
MMHRFVLHNDDICEASAKLLSPGQIGFGSGWGVFSTMRIVRGIPFAFERHWERMKRDAATLRVPFPAEPGYMRSRLLRLIAANQACDSAARTIVVRNQGGVWEGPPEREFDLLAFTASLKDWGAGVKLAVQEQGRHAASRFRGVKCLSWALNLVLLEEAQSQGYDEVLLLNERGEVSECTSANVFIERGGEVLTPPLSSGCLPGVTRDLLFEIGPAEGITVREETLRLEDVLSANEVFVTSTTRNLLPVVSVGGRPVAHQGQLCGSLERAFERAVDAYVAAHQADPLPGPPASAHAVEGTSESTPAHPSCR